MKAYLWSADGGPPPPATKHKWRRFVERRLPTVVIYLMIANAGRHRALPSRRGDGSERACRRPVETIRRRHRDRSAQAQGRGAPLHFAVGRGVPIRFAGAIRHRDLQRHLERRREPDRDPQYQVSAQAQFHPYASPGDRSRTTSSCWALESPVICARSSRNSRPSRFIRRHASRSRTRSAKPRSKGWAKK